MSLMTALERVYQLNELIAHGSQTIQERGSRPDELPSIDGITTHPVSHQQRSFYEFACGWTHAAVELLWSRPADLPALVASEPVLSIVEQDVEENFFCEGERVPCTRNMVLFALDDPHQPYQRAYFDFGTRTDGEPGVIEIGDGVRTHDDLAGYVGFWARVMAA